MAQCGCLRTGAGLAAPPESVMTVATSVKTNTSTAEPPDMRASVPALIFFAAPAEEPAHTRRARGYSTRGTLMARRARPA